MSALYVPLSYNSSKEIPWLRQMCQKKPSTTSSMNQTPNIGKDGCHLEDVIGVERFDRDDFCWNHCFTMHFDWEDQALPYALAAYSFHCSLRSLASSRPLYLGVSSSAWNGRHRCVDSLLGNPEFLIPRKSQVDLILESEGPDKFLPLLTHSVTIITQPPTCSSITVTNLAPEPESAPFRGLF